MDDSSKPSMLKQRTGPVIVFRLYIAGNSENSLTARSWRRLRTNNTMTPTARMAEVRNHKTTEGKINADLDDDEF